MPGLVMSAIWPSRTEHALLSEQGWTYRLSRFYPTEKCCPIWQPSS